MENEIKVIPFGELSDSLKEEVIEYFQSDEFLVPEDWYEWVLEGISETYKFVDIDSESVEFDMNYGVSLKYTGEIDLDHKTIKQYLTDDYEKWTEKEWIDDFPTSFENDELYDGFDILTDIIFEEIEDEIFGSIDLIVEDGKVIIPLSIKLNIEKAIIEYGSFDDIEFLKEILNLINAAELFFQDEVIVEEDAYDDFMSGISTEMENEISDSIADIIVNINGELSEVYDDYKSSLQDSYDHYFTVEYAEENLSDREFEVEFDENGEQLSIDDLNGDWS